MIGIVVVSHSAMLAAGLKALADQLGSPAKLLLAAGVDDPAHPIGTDAIAVMSAMEEADDGSGVLVLMDLGSALLSAETALELLPPELSAPGCGSAPPRWSRALWPPWWPLAQA